MLVGAVALGRGATPQDVYCAFEVTVRSPDGAAVGGVTVTEEAQDGGQVASAVTDARGGARLCDAPAGLVSIRVWGRLCGAASVEYLMPHWLKTRRVYLTYESCSGEEWAVPGGCEFTLRVRDAQGAPIPRARFEDQKTIPGIETRESDPFGRIFRFVRYGEAMSGRVDKEGYSSQDVNRVCRSGGPSRAEVTVVMRAVR